MRLSDSLCPLIFAAVCCSVATIGLAYLRADLALNECRREQVRLGFQEDMRARNVAWTARKQAAEKAHEAAEAAVHTQHTHRSTQETVVPTTEEPTNPSAIAAARHDGSYRRTQSIAADSKAGK